jgi:dTMP kinase
VTNTSITISDKFKFYISGAKMQASLSRGTFLAFEGCDRSGKTTQVERLVEKLNKEGKLTKLIKFPMRTTTIGKVIHSFLTGETELEDHAVHLLFSANRWEMEKDIMATLESGVNVIVDRYAYSGVAYSAAKPGLSLSWCRQSDSGLPRPDLVCFLQITEAVASQRPDYGGERYETTDFQNKVITNFSSMKHSGWYEIMADRSMDEVERDIYEKVLTEITKKNKGEVQKLWTK